jgi:Flp pilus assembly protein TadB
MAAIWTGFIIVGALALAVIATHVRRGYRRGKHINRILSADASERAIRRAQREHARRQQGGK